MLNYTKTPDSFLTVGNGKIACFHADESDNIDQETVDSFGEEWKKFDEFEQKEIEKIGDEYFDVVPKEVFGENKQALDVGCGSGRWTLYVANKFGRVEGIDPSNSVIVAHNSTQKLSNVRITKAGVDRIPFKDEAFDFVFSLGVLHHIPDTEAAMQKAVAKLKVGGYFLVYLYYALDNRGFIYKAIFHTSSVFRYIISKLPQFLKKFICDVIAVFIYLPFVWVARILKKMNIQIWNKVPLSYYVGKSFFVIRNDALDRFGTPLEQRFSKEEIRSMMEHAGLTEIVFSNQSPFWHAIGKKA